MQEEYFKDFDKWNGYKRLLDSTKFERFLREGEIWWCALGVNVGSEEDGKNESFERPVVILKKINQELLLVAPLTTQITSHGNRLKLQINGENSQIMFSQIRVISNKRFLRKITRLKMVTSQKIILAFLKFILNVSIDENETPPFGGESRGP